jgi:hypothetical protein
MVNAVETTRESSLKTLLKEATHPLEKAFILLTFEYGLHPREIVKLNVDFVSSQFPSGSSSLYSFTSPKNDDAIRGGGVSSTTLAALKAYMERDREANRKEPLFTSPESERIATEIVLTLLQRGANTLGL